MKRRSYKGRELLPLAVSDAARTGDANAVEQVLRFTMKAAVPICAWTST